MFQTRLVDEFRTRFVEQAGNIHFAKSAEEAARIANSIARKLGKGRMCCASFTLCGKEFETLIDVDLPFEKLTSGDSLKELESIDIGVTLSDAAISQTGSLVEISNSDNYKLLSSISRIHITILDSANILANLSDLAPKIRSVLSSGKKPNITLIGGPSRTSDIEMKSVLGVHGPHEVHVIIVEQ